MKTVVAILSVDDRLIEGYEDEEGGHDFKSEMGWVNESGIFMLDYTSVKEDVHITYQNGRHSICEAVNERTDR